MPKRADFRCLKTFPEEQPNYLPITGVKLLDCLGNPLNLLRSGGYLVRWRLGDASSGQPSASESCGHLFLLRKCSKSLFRSIPLTHRHTDSRVIRGYLRKTPDSLAQALWQVDWTTSLAESGPHPLPRAILRRADHCPLTNFPKPERLFSRSTGSWLMPHPTFLWATIAFCSACYPPQHSL